MTQKARIDSLYEYDQTKKCRASYENEEIVALYNDYLKCPNSELAKELLHTKYFDKSEMLGQSQLPNISIKGTKSEENVNSLLADDKFNLSLDML